MAVWTLEEWDDRVTAVRGQVEDVLLWNALSTVDDAQARELLSIVRETAEALALEIDAFSTSLREYGAPCEEARRKLADEAKQVAGRTGEIADNFAELSEPPPLLLPFGDVIEGTLSYVGPLLECQAG